LKWVDVAGCPGSGKSTLAYPLWQDRSVGWDGKLPPSYWRPFLDEMTSLMRLVSDHPTFEAVLRMNDRSAKKMATVGRMTIDYSEDRDCFIQTGLVQRILGFGWRLHEMGRDINLIRPALWRMPVSVGVAFLEASLETLLARNRERRNDPRTAHEDRSHQVPHMLAVIPLAKEVMLERGIPIVSIDVEQPVEAARAELVRFARAPACHAAQMGCGGQGPLLQTPPLWWRS